MRFCFASSADPVYYMPSLIEVCIIKIHNVLSCFASPADLIQRWRRPVCVAFTPVFIFAFFVFQCWAFDLHAKDLFKLFCN